MLAMHSTTNANNLNLQLESSLQELPMWEVQIELQCPGGELIKLFEQEPLLPGIIVTRNQCFVGMISRQKFFEHMSRPYSFGLFSRRPLKSLYNFLKPDFLMLPGEFPIVEATKKALQRSFNLVYEPILVATSSGKYGLVDFHQLLLAYSQIYALTLTKLQLVEEQSKIAKAGFRDLQHNYTRLLQNEKMAALGQLVAGIAHEINNPVNFIAGNIVHSIDYTESLLELISLYQQHYPKPVQEIQAKISEIDLNYVTADFPNLLASMKYGCDRIEEIVKSLRNFSRLDEADKKIVDIHEGMDSTLLILRSRFKEEINGKRITLVKEYGNIPLIECYPGLLNQVFMNIVANAIDALVENFPSSSLKCNLPQNNPTICIRTELTNDQYVKICIADNGIGIAEDIQKHLFDPFFTTKPVGKGTGLGLSISYQIVVEKHRGQLNCLSTLGKGTEFIITIPVTAPNFQ
ncbi:ATPase [Nostoc sp. FACHB-152]|uniref:sensor histidine kinase n=1 Tax=unclassified Nostoc TaxID=2593658 RepID=UPI00168433E1|nr:MULTISPECIES: ATP-binding protein [unclassified Nostoc]MBD2445763.1 ATPase [Nostoc sp. FACHB-152]MBD2466877.1 ATPase [Nostoc sp. FACHB-145]